MRAEAELKFLLSGKRAARLLSAIEHELKHIRYGNENATSFARTIYLDSDEQDYLRSTHGPVRRRLRIREYATATEASERPQLSGACFLELKESRGVVRRKTRVAVPAWALRTLLLGRQVATRWERAINQVAAFRPLLADIRSGRLRPRMTSFCRRSAHSGPGLRVTIDSSLVFCQPALPGEFHDPNTAVASEPRRVLEIKTTEGLPSWLTTLLEEQTAVRFSKFEAGMVAVNNRSGRLVRGSAA